jgi:hypothetical protein
MSSISPAIAWFNPLTTSEISEEVAGRLLDGGRGFHAMQALDLDGHVEQMRPHLGIRGFTRRLLFSPMLQWMECLLHVVHGPEQTTV